VNGRAANEVVPSSSARDLESGARDHGIGRCRTRYTSAQISWQVEIGNRRKVARPLIRGSQGGLDERYPGRCERHKRAVTLMTLDQTFFIGIPRGALGFDAVDSVSGPKRDRVQSFIATTLIQGEQQGELTRLTFAKLIGYRHRGISWK
jgi:hypothetical protein